MISKMFHVRRETMRHAFWLLRINVLTIDLLSHEKLEIKSRLAKGQSKKEKGQLLCSIYLIMYNFSL